MTPVPSRPFKHNTKKSGIPVKWLSRNTVYEGTLISMTNRIVRLVAPARADLPPHVDLSYDWLIPVR